LVKAQPYFLNMVVCKKDSLIKTLHSLCLLILLSTIYSTVYAVEVIMHPSVDDTILTTSQLRRIYTMRQIQWSNGKRITVYTLPRQHPLHLRFSKERLQMFPYQLDRIWNKLTYSGLGVAPITINTPEELLEAVRSTPGAIGYVDKAQGMEGVHVVQIKD
jgi:ABC-type phosphate transport system substrate-binding protein